jgi:hypothetical protein
MERGTQRGEIGKQREGEGQATRRGGRRASKQEKKASSLEGTRKQRAVVGK